MLFDVVYWIVDGEYWLRFVFGVWFEDCRFCFCCVVVVGDLCCGKECVDLGDDGFGEWC